jgi:uncharacterized repeat protein (TIGR01451 family)
VKIRIAILLLLVLDIGSTQAQTGGPGQPEFMQFKAASASDLVNPSTGSFSYNIPLFDVGGYPVNLSYQSGAQMEDVASIVGLGWNINIGAVSHTMRGLPDDFSGDIVTRTTYMKPNITYGGNIGVGVEVIGFPIGAGLSAGFGVFYNNYNGYGVEQSYGVSFSMHNKANTARGAIGLGMKANSQTGVDIYAQPTVSMQMSKTGSMAANGSIGGMISVNSREGAKASINASMDVSRTEKLRDDKGTVLTSNGQDREVSQQMQSTSASYSFSKTPEIPRVSYPFLTESYSGSFKAGGEIWFLHPHGELKGYFTSQKLASNVIATPAYGLLYSENATGENVLHDFSRQMDQPYIKDASVNIGIPYYTNDIYSVNAQGIGGSFQLNRGDIGVIFDNRVASGGTAFNLGIEVGFGNALHVGADISTTTTTSSSGKWNSALTHKVEFKGAQKNVLYQSAYFKNASDVTIDENGFYDKLQGDKPIEAEIDDANWWQVNVDTKPKLVDDYNAGSSMYVTDVKNLRDPRTINIQFKTASLAKTHGLLKTIDSYPINSFNCTGVIEHKGRETATHKAHHISEMSATNADGMRYVFGIPTYNTVQKEVTFTLDQSQAVGADGLVQYMPHAAWGSNGKDGFYESTSLPPYVTSHLLTAVLSPEYIDQDDNGPSLNDVGNYVKINYSAAGSYKWRTPYDKDKATFNRAMLSDNSDNKGSYVYGEKELWYTHSIESKTQIAEFYYDTQGRKDGLGVLDEQGGVGLTQKLYKLDSIKVYAINERILKGNLASPIRTIYFAYDYELCPKIKNSTSSATLGEGKLTLKRLSFSSGNSRREVLSPYKFTYGVMPAVGTAPPLVVNPDFGPMDINRWGNYQKNLGGLGTAVSSIPSNVDFPYSSQDVALMTKNAYAWNLTEIKLPSGGLIKAEYEPHRYAFTQDKRCMQMFSIEATGGSKLSLASNGNSTSGLFLKVKLEAPITGGDPELIDRYFNNDLKQYYYYKALVTLRPSYPEWIAGYLKIKSATLIDATHAAIELESVCRDDKGCGVPVNPIAKNAWQFMRMNRSELCYGPAAPPTGGLESFLKLSDLNAKVSDQITAFFSGFNDYAQSEQFAKELVLANSYIRLCSPNKSKIMGGTRVKRVITDDDWYKQSGNSSEGKVYTIDYDYTHIERNSVTGLPDTVSSGVMEYEPSNGQDENPIKQPVFINQQIKMAPDNELFVEKPFNEALFPASNLTYSKVRVTSNRTHLQVPGVGFQELEFFTAKDYPISSDITDLGDNHEKKTNFLAAFAMSVLGVAEFHDYLTLSQGAVIRLNDMHGKPRATKNYNATGSLISSESFEYSLGKPLNLLSRSNHHYTSDKLGVSVSAVCDSRTTEHATEVIGANLNLDLTFAPLFPLTMFMPLPNMSVENTRLNTVAFNKIVTKKGILTKKTVTENTATVSTENILFDDKTGFVLLTKTTNEFNDPLFKFHYPADWIYEGLSAGYVSSDLEFTVSNPSTGNLFSVLPDVFTALAIGDEIIIPSSSQRFWLMEKILPSEIRLESKILGGTSQISSPYICQVLRPGRRNQLMQEAGSVVTHADPRTPSLVSFSQPKMPAAVINTSMQEFSDARAAYCDCDSSGLMHKCDVTSPRVIPGPDHVLRNPVPPSPVIAAAKLFLGTCKDGIASGAGPWAPGSTVRWRIAVANIGNFEANRCKIIDQLPASFTYAGNTAYSISTLVPTGQMGVVCATSTSTPLQIGQFTAKPTVGDNTLAWEFGKLMIQATSTVDYLNIDFDVLIGSEVSQGTYCNNFAFNCYGRSQTLAVASQSNNAQVTITSGSYPNGSSLPKNPYATGEKGNWYPTTTWSYLTDRTRSTNLIEPATNVRYDGSFKTFNSFWQHKKHRWVKDATNWQWVESVSVKDVNGLTLETRDVLDRHNTLQTGYRNKLVVAEVGNATINEVAYEGFEDWTFRSITSNCDSAHPCMPRSIAFDQVFNLNTSQAHSGRYSGELTGAGISLNLPVIQQQPSVDPSMVSYSSPLTESPGRENRSEQVGQTNMSITNKEVLRDAQDIDARPDLNEKLPPKDCIAKFELHPNTSYVICAWVRDVTDPLATTFDDPLIKVNGVQFGTSGNILDGWQRIYGEFTTSTSPSIVSISFHKGVGQTFVDDIRIFPFDAKMTTHVYDGNTEKLTFTSDENNYFTRYNYDASDNLESVSKETERGVQTIKESHAGSVKIP